MGKVRVAAFAISIDGFGAGPNQSENDPLGKGGIDLHQWVFPTKTFRTMHTDSADGETGIDNDFAAKALENVGAWILGRNMFSPHRGPWKNHDWKGWWGPNPPYHVPVFILTHHDRPTLEMEGGTTFYFITEGLEQALEKAKKAAKGKDVRIGGGVKIVREYLKLGLIDELHLVISPTLLGSGEHLLQGIDLTKLGFKCVESTATQKATHYILRKSE